jgi:hypothetical protein
MSMTSPLEHPPSPYSSAMDAEMRRMTEPADARAYQPHPQAQVGLTLSETAAKLKESKSRHQLDLDASAALAERRRVAISQRAERLFGTVISHLTSRRATTLGVNSEIMPSGLTTRHQMTALAENCFSISEIFEDQREAWEQKQLEKQEVS